MILYQKQVDQFSNRDFVFIYIHDLTLIDEGKKFGVSVRAGVSTRAMLVGREPLQRFPLTSFRGSSDREIGLSRLSLGLSCASFPLCIPLTSEVSRGGPTEVSRNRNRSVKAAARPAAASVSLRHARDLVLPRASSVSGVVSPPSPFHSPSRWPLLVPSVESGGLRESLETTT